MARQKTHKLSHAAARRLEADNYGPEPEFSGSPLSVLDEVHALNWYAYMGDPSEARAYLKNWLVAQGRQDEVRKLMALPEWAIPKTAGWVVRIMDKGGTFPTDKTLFIEDKLKESFTFLNWTPEQEANNEVVIELPVRKVHDEKTSDLIAKIDEILDQRDETFSVYDYLRDRNIIGKVARQIIEHYQPLADELKLAVSKGDPQIVEAYSHLSKGELKSYMALVEKVIEDAEKFNDVKKASRKPRKKKVKSSSDILKFMTPKDNDEEFKLKSVHPSQILGASEVWLFNCVYKTLTVLHAKDDKGLTVHRTAIVGYNEEKSLTKRVGRKAGLILPIVLTGGKVERRKLLEKVKTDKIDLKNRVSNDVIILRASK